MSCVVPNCKSFAGKYPLGVTKHLIPGNVKRREQWIKAIPRKDWEPSKFSVVCSLHFEDSDYREHRNDGNLSRRKQKGSLIKKQLKPTAVPRIFPGLPSYLSSKSPCVRSEKATSFARHVLASKQADEQAKQFLASDLIESFFELKMNFEKHLPPSSENIFSVKKSDTVFIEELVFYDDGPKILYGLKIEDDLKFKAVVNGSLLSQKRLSHICQEGIIHRFSDIPNILSFLQSLSENKV